MNSDVCIVMVSLPRDEATMMARSLVEERLAACVNIIPKIESFYWWDGRVESDSEALLIIKSTNERFDALQEWVLEHHPYALPEVIALPLTDAFADYVAWVKKETTVE